MVSVTPADEHHLAVTPLISNGALLRSTHLQRHVLCIPHRPYRRKQRSQITSRPERWRLSTVDSGPLKPASTLKQLVRVRWSDERQPAPRELGFTRQRRTHVCLLPAPPLFLRSCVQGHSSRCSLVLLKSGLQRYEASDCSFRP